MRNFMLLLLMLIVVNCQELQQQKTSDKVEQNIQQESQQIINKYNHDSFIGVIIVLILLVGAYILGKTGRNYIYNQVGNNQNKQEEEIENEQKEMGNPQDLQEQHKISIIKRVNYFIQTKINQFKREIMKRTSDKHDTVTLNKVEMAYNQFDFEDSI